MVLEFETHQNHTPERNYFYFLRDDVLFMIDINSFAGHNTTLVVNTSWEKNRLHLINRFPVHEYSAYRALTREKWILPFSFGPKKKYTP